LLLLVIANLRARSEAPGLYRLGGGSPSIAEHGCREILRSAWKTAALRMTPTGPPARLAPIPY